MKFGNHLLSGILLTEIYFASTGELWRPILLFGKDRFIENGLIFSGLMMGAIFPDVDIKLNSPGLHRTITHWPYLYYLALGAVFFIERIWDVGPSSLTAASFCLGVQTHIILDLTTPMGVPLGKNPFGKRFSLFWFEVGSAKEKCFSGGMFLFGFVVFF